MMNLTVKMLLLLALSAQLCAQGQTRTTAQPSLLLRDDAKPYASHGNARFASSLPPLLRQQPNNEPRKLDEFGDIQLSDWLARLDNFATELQNSPGAHGYIIAYAKPAELPGWPLRRARWARWYLVKSRGLDAARVRVIDGGFRQSVMFELWVALSGGRPPTATPTLPSLNLTSGQPALKFDRYFLFEPVPGWGADGSYGEYEDHAGRFDAFISAVLKEPGARGLVVVYANRRDARSRAQGLAERERRAILKLGRIGGERILARGGARRDHRTVELWLVPPGASLPKLTPPARTSRRR
jgi:hypothetical protein